MQVSHRQVDALLDKTCFKENMALLLVISSVPKPGLVSNSLSGKKSFIHAPGLTKF